MREHTQTNRSVDPTIVMLLRFMIPANATKLKCVAYNLQHTEQSTIKKPIGNLKHVRNTKNNIEIIVGGGGGGSYNLLWATLFKLSF
jgi:hypothetical protein